jgi:cell wall-associated NlpC family hydrolase
MAQAGLAVQQKLLAQTQAAFGSKPIGVTPIRLATAAVATAQAAVASASTTLSAKQLAASIAAATLKTVTAQTGPVISASNAIMNQYDTEAAAAMAAAATAAAAKFDSAYNRVISLKKNLGLSGQTICAKQLGSNYSGVVSNACSNLKNAQFDLTWARTNAALDPGRRAKPDP